MESSHLKQVVCSFLLLCSHPFPFLVFQMLPPKVTLQVSHLHSTRGAGPFSQNWDVVSFILQKLPSLHLGVYVSTLQLILLLLKQSTLQLEQDLHWLLAVTAAYATAAANPLLGK